MENVAGEQGLESCSPTSFSIQTSYSFKYDGGLKLGHFDIFDILFPFLAFVKFKPIIL